MKLRTGPTEAEFTTQIIQLARLYGWLAHHCIPLRTARGWATGVQGDAGLPDLVLAKGGRVILAEIKVGRNQPTDQQRAWIEAAGAHLWRPADWDCIERTLRGA